MPNAKQVSGSEDDNEYKTSGIPLVANLTRQMTLKYEEMKGGPLPPPQALLEYESLLPGTAERLLTLHEKRFVHQLELERTEAEHRRGNERLELLASISHNRNGPFFAIVAVTMLLGLAAYVTFSGYPQTAGAITTALVVGLAIAFLTPRVLARIDAPLLQPDTQLPPAVTPNPK